jgi:hypothetical protein
VRSPSHCQTVGYAFPGSDPGPATTCETAPEQCVCRSGLTLPWRLDAALELTGGNDAHKAQMVWEIL